MGLLPKEKKTKPPKKEKKKKESADIPEENSGFPEDAVASDSEIDDILRNIFG